LNEVGQDEMDEKWSQAIYWRGLFMQRYSGIEFALSRLIMVARDHAVYNHLGDMPFKFSSKLKRLDEICALSGPVATYKTEFAILTCQLLQQEENRHFMAHAIMNVRLDEHGDYVVKFSMYDHRVGIVHAGQWSVEFDKMDDLSASIESISSQFMPLATEACQAMVN
jgi:hypothetical protein